LKFIYVKQIVDGACALIDQSEHIDCLRLN